VSQEARILFTARDGAEFDVLAAQLSALRLAPLTSAVLRGAEDAMRTLAHRSAGSQRLPVVDYLVAAAAQEMGAAVTTTTATTTRSQRSWSSSRSGWRLQGDSRSSHRAGAFIAWGLHARYLEDVLLARAEVPPHRERPDLIVAGGVRTAASVGIVAGGLLAGFQVTPPLAGIAPETPLALAIVAAAILLSSLVDWYVILPRISGLLGAGPCRAPTAITRASPGRGAKRRAGGTSIA
jgi:hypothetical protein